MNDKTRKYWRSFDELNETEAYQAEVVNEFQDELDISSPEQEGTSRRGFLGWVSASLAASGLAGCDAIRRPVEKILPYSVAPEEILPGIPQYYATTTSLGGEVVGVLVESHEGRPTKIEGNPLHRGSYGALNNLHQSQVLDLYDPQRLRASRSGDKSDLSADAVKAILAQKGKSWAGKKVAFLAEALPSVQIATLRDGLVKSLGAQWYTYESVSDDNEREGMKAVFGEAVRPVYNFSGVKTILSLDSDFLATEGSAVANAHSWAETRRMGADGSHNLSRMYAVEARYSVTGTNADHRVRTTHAEVEAFAFEVARGLGVNAPHSTVALSTFQKDAAKQIVADLKANQGHALVLAGRNQPAIVHAITAVMNEALGASVSQVKYHTDARRAKDAMGDMEGAKALTTALSGGQVDALVIIGGNPAYTFPADLKFADAVKKAGEVVYLSDMENETTQAIEAAKSTVIARAHYLESWGDTVGIDGQVAIQQPLIQPIHKAVSDLEVLAALAGDAQAQGYALVRGAWKAATGSAGFHKRWRKWLHEGVLEDQHVVGTSPSKKATDVGSLGASSMKNPSTDKLDVIFVSGHNSFDGRFANNSWLMELPDPLTKITWDNAAVVSPKTAKDLGVVDQDMVEVTLGGVTLKTVAWILPGQADNTVTLTLGYGRTFSNFLPYHEGSYNDKKETGFNVGLLRNSGSASVAAGASVKATGGTYVVAAVQRHDNSRQYSIEGFDVGKRPALVREASLTEYKANETFAKAGIIAHHKMPDTSKFAVVHPPEESIFGDYRNVSDEQRESHPNMPDYTKGIQWGMVIDLNTCTGCNACMVACVAENNIAMVGKDQVRRGREMHWIRMDRYFVGDENNPEVVHQPLACQQCETAPCENVCPVAATVHSPEGLNDMVYNRCIGTRYCANNCPFKVRRFNFYNYSKDQPELFHMQRNPNVTVRFRGVMEKCTYCVQRINKGKRRAALNPEVATQIIARITPACAQGCPTKAIIFGDINDSTSEVAKYKNAARDYRLLSELNVQGRTSFLAKIRNPNPNFPTASASSSTQAG